jgi:hypothetical protein
LQYLGSIGRDVIRHEQGNLGLRPLILFRIVRFAVSAERRAIDVLVRQQTAAFFELERDVEAGLLLGEHVAAPGSEDISPSLDGVDVASRPRRHEAAAPAIVAVEMHRDAMPAVSVLGPPQQLGGEYRMPVPEDVCPHLERFSGDALHRKTSRVDRGIDVFDVDALSGEIAD